MLVPRYVMSSVCGVKLGFNEAHFSMFLLWAPKDKANLRTAIATLQTLYAWGFWQLYEGVQRIIVGKCRQTPISGTKTGRPSGKKFAKRRPMEQGLSHVTLEMADLPRTGWQGRL